jgi:hypothetical protein
VIYTTYDSFETEEDSAYVNGNQVDDADILRRWVIDELGEREQCPYCTAKFVFADNARDADQDTGRCSTLAVCDTCGFWQWNHNVWFPRGASWSAYMAKVREFDAVPSHCQTEIAQSIRRNPMLLHSMSPKLLEQHVAAVLKANYADSEAIHVGQSHDGGVDVLFVDAGGTQSLVQVKRRTNPDASEGVVTVRNLLGVMAPRRVLKGIIVSTADHFTYEAYATVAEAKAAGYEVSLVDKGKLLRMLPPLIPKRPWRKAVRELAPNLSSLFSRQLQAQGVTLNPESRRIVDLFL